MSEEQKPTRKQYKEWLDLARELRSVQEARHARQIETLKMAQSQQAATNATLRAELLKANTAWGAAKAQLAERTEDRDRLAGQLDRRQAELDRKLRECADLNAQLSRIRAAESKLHDALYPAKINPKPPFPAGVSPLAPVLPAFPGPLTPFAPPPFVPPYTINGNSNVHVGANYDPSLQDKMDRLEEAGYDCNREQHKAYSGLVGG